MYVLWDLKRDENTGDGTWAGELTTLTSFFDVQVTKGMQGGSEGASFKIPNTRNSQNLGIKPMDIIKFYYKINGASSDDNTNLVMVGLVKKVNLEKSGGSSVLRVECESYSALLTNALVFYDPGETTQNVMQYLKGCLDSVNLRNEKFGITWNSDNPLTNKFNPSSGLYNGGAFPTFTSSTNKIRDYDKSFKKLIDDYLVGEFTGDGSYFWFINNSKELVIRKRIITSTPGDLQLRQGSDFENIKIRTNGDDVKNFIVIKCGFDLNNNPISARYDDFTSRAKHGFRYHLMVDRTIAQNLKDRNPGISNSDLISAVKAEGYAKAKTYAELHNKGYLEVSAQTKPRLDLNAGNNVLFTSLSYADYNTGSSVITQKVMRVRSVQYDRDGLLIDLKEEAV
jgi:hypothetical protein